MQVTANATHNADLLEAMHGAGAVFGVVAELTFKLYNVSGLYGGHVLAKDDINGTNFR